MLHNIFNKRSLTFLSNRSMRIGACLFQVFMLESLFNDHRTNPTDMKLYILQDFQGKYPKNGQGEILYLVQIYLLNNS